MVGHHQHLMQQACQDLLMLHLRLLIMVGKKSQQVLQIYGVVIVPQHTHLLVGYLVHGQHHLK